MLWYAETPSRRARQLIGDLLAVGWLLLCLLLGRTVAALITTLAAPADPLRGAGSGLQRRMSDVADTITAVPLVGTDLSGPFLGAAGVGGRLTQAGDDLESAVAHLALVGGIVTALVPLVLVLGVYLILRVRYASRAGQLARARRHPQLRELLALRALVNQPARRLTDLTPDPLGQWRAGDAELIDALMALELQRAGLRLGPRSTEG
ncbi:MAG: hypothetical protein WA892_12250 [Ornithinimicrobium sp.]